MKKHTMALLAALFITLCVGASMLTISASAYLNKNGSPVANTPAEATATAQVKSQEQAQIQQLQDLVTQYQQREAQYQQELNTAGKNLQQAQAQLQQFQMLLMELQNRGLIAVNPDGSISIAR